jgi:hypothetical protein
VESLRERRRLVDLDHAGAGHGGVTLACGTIPAGRRTPIPPIDEVDPRRGALEAVVDRWAQLVELLLPVVGVQWGV